MKSTPFSVPFIFNGILVFFLSRDQILTRFFSTHPIYYFYFTLSLIQLHYWYAIDTFNENGITAGTVCKMQMKSR